MFFGAVLLLAEITLLNVIQGLSLDERNELSRKFKYYFASVRPNQRPNRVSTINGTFFSLNTEIQLISTLPRNGELNVELFLIVNFVDDRLVLRELDRRFLVSPEFRPWLPDIATFPDIPLNISVYLDPRSGVVTAFYKLHSALPCTSDAWRHPFEVFFCDLIISNGGDERLVLESLRDLRSEFQQYKVPFSSENWPTLALRFTFSHKWHSSLVTSLLPSLLVFCVVIFAQWKRRKVQVLVTAVSLLSIVIMQSTHRSSNAVTLEDLWLSCTFLHVVCVLLVDLTLPARRVRYNLVVDDEFNRKTSPGVVRLPFVAGEAVIEESLARSGSVDAHVVPNQRHITTTSIGKRKRIALCAIVVCYLVFVITYISTVLSILLSQR